MARRPLAVRFGPHHRRLLLFVLAGVWLSGCVWLSLHYLLAPSDDFGTRPPVEAASLRLHGLFSFATLVAVGSVLPVHVRPGWQRGRNRATGATMMLLLFWLAATGYALYYFASDTNAAWLPVVHWSVGLALPITLWLHARRALRRRGHAPRARPDGHAFGSPIGKEEDAPQERHGSTHPAPYSAGGD